MVDPDLGMNFAEAGKLAKAAGERKLASAALRLSIAQWRALGHTEEVRRLKALMEHTPVSSEQ